MALVINKYIIFILVCVFELCLCRRPSRPRPGSGFGLEGWIVIAFIIFPNIFGWISYAITYNISKRPKVAEWGESLKLPRFYPPGWVIILIWTILYSAIGYASYMVYRDCDGFTTAAALPLTLYGILLLLKTTCSPLLNGFRKTCIGFYHFIAIDMVASACAISFFYINKYTLYCTAPYLVFLIYMTISMYLFWRINEEDTLETELIKTKF